MIKQMIKAPEKGCTGCAACANICPQNCINMKEDRDGFFYPNIEYDNCIECRLCENICPLNKKEQQELVLPQAYAAFINDEELRMGSSSGGCFSVIAKWVIKQNGVVYGAAYDNSFKVFHLCVDNINDLSKLRGAKYAESYLGTTFKEILSRLELGQFVLFSGTPCQVAGLKAYLRKDYDNLISVDCVCHGIPSPRAWKEYLKIRMKEDDEEELPCSINLRSKKTGWSRYQYSSKFQYLDGKEFTCKNSYNLFMKLFVGNYINRESCNDCKFKGYGRLSDFTLGDFWGIWDIMPELDDNKGTSVVLLQSEKSKKIWGEIKNEMTYREVTLEQASQQNPSMLFSSKAQEKREMVLGQIRSGKIEECRMLFEGEKIAMLAKIKKKIKKILTIRCIILYLIRC